MDMHPTRLALTLLIGMLLSFAPACDVNNRPTSGLDVKFSASLVLRDGAGNATAEFDAGEPVTFELTVTNLLSEQQRIVFPDSQTFEFEIRDPSGQKLWNWAHGQAFLTVLTAVEFAPGESKRFTHTWDQTGNDGRAVGPGDYDARGFLPIQLFGVRARPVGLKIAS